MTRHQQKKILQLMDASLALSQTHEARFSSIKNLANKLKKGWLFPELNDPPRIDWMRDAVIELEAECLVALLYYTRTAKPNALNLMKLQKFVFTYRRLLEIEELLD